MDCEGLLVGKHQFYTCWTVDCQVEEGGSFGGVRRGNYGSLGLTALAWHSGHITQSSSGIFDSEDEIDVPRGWCRPMVAHEAVVSYMSGSDPAEGECLLLSAALA